MKIYITGLGCISSIGLNVEDNLQSLRSETDGLSYSNYLNSKYATLKYFGEVNLDTEDLRRKLNLTHIKGLTRTDVLAISAFREAIGDAKLSASEISADDTAFISASTVGGMCMTDQLYKDSNLVSAASDYVRSYSTAAHTLLIAKEYHIKGVTGTINTACSSAANAIMLGMRLIRSGRVKRAIVGGSESLAKYTVNGFNSLQILSDQKCLPFDNTRNGLNLGEAAAYIVLESDETCKNKRKYATLVGAGNSNDAFHASSMSDNALGVTKCMEFALDDAKISPDKIGYINAHGTATPNNDSIELIGFSNVFSQVPPFSSTKSYTGHTLGASGALEAIYSVFSLFYNEIYPSLRSADLPENSASLVRKYKKADNLEFVMSNSYGFGGNCTSLIFQKYETQCTSQH